MPRLLSILGPKAIPALSVPRVGPKLKKVSGSLPAKPIFHMPPLPAELPPQCQVRPRLPVTSGWPLLSQEANQDQFTELLASGLLKGSAGHWGIDPPRLTCAPSERLCGSALLFTLLPSKLPLSPHLQGLLLSCLKDFTAN